MGYEYLEKERKLLNHFGIDDRMIDSPSCSAVSLYRIATENAFVGQRRADGSWWRRDEGCETESLRRCGRAIQEGKVFRLTPEWDDLIELWEA